MNCSSFERLPDSQGIIAKNLLPKVRNRNRTLLLSGAESCLLYIPDGHKTSSVWDPVRQTYSTQDIKYKLYLNRTKFNGCPLYTSKAQSILIGIPANPDDQSHREEGLLWKNQSNAWTLWDPIIPPRGSIIVQQNTPYPEDTRMWLVENVTMSYFPNFDKSQNYLLHQEFRLGLLTEEFPVKLSDLPTVNDTLAIVSNKFTTNTTGFTLTGSSSVTGGNLKMNSGSTLRTQLSTFLNNKVEFTVKTLTSPQNLDINLGKWTTAVPRPFVRLNFASNSIQFSDGTTVYKTYLRTFTSNTTYKVSLQYSNGLLTLSINDVPFLARLNNSPAFSTGSPLLQDTIQLSTSSNIEVSNMYVMELL